MEIQMDTLREFLLERILEEEALAQAAIDAHPPLHAWDLADDADGAHFNHWNPWRVLSSCVAKRLIIAAHRDVGAGVDRRADPDRTLKAHACSTCGQYDEYAIEWPCYTLRVLALDWVDHPAYRQEWRPQRLSSGVGRAPAASASLEPATRAETALGVPAPAIPAPAASAPAASPPSMPAQAGSPESRRPGQPAA
jgi:hypothetical protein